MKYIIYIIIGVISGIVANYFGYHANDLNYWLISLGIIIPANLAVYLS